MNTAKRQPLTPTIGDVLGAEQCCKEITSVQSIDRQLILAHVVGVSRSWLYAHSDEPLDDASQTRFEALVAKRRAGVPVAYLTGHRWFWNAKLEVTQATLVPRPETELLVEAILQRLDDSCKTIMDAGTGSGAIAIALAQERPSWQVYASDFSVDALVVARRNLDCHAIRGISLLQGNWLSAIGAGRLDAIVCNPPYIPEGDVHLHPLRHEPLHALVSGIDGLDAIRQIVAESARCLRSGGWLVMEHGFNQAGETRGLAASAGFLEIETLQDLNDLPRALIARMPQ